MNDIMELWLGIFRCDNDIVDVLEREKAIPLTDAHHHIYR
jgi:hypothetical protein